MDINRLWHDVVTPAKASLIIFVLGYVLKLSSLSTSNIGGEVTCSYSDMSALLFGVLGLVTAGYAIKEARSPRVPTNLNYGIAAVGAILGLINIARGLGMIDSPCG